MGVRSSAASVSTEIVDGSGVVVATGKRGVVEVSSDGRPAPARSSEEGGGQPEGLEMLYDEGYGSASVMDYFDVARQLIRPDGGPPRWFCPVECGRPIAGAPVLLFLPGNNCCFAFSVISPSISVMQIAIIQIVNSLEDQQFISLVLIWFLG